MKTFALLVSVTFTLVFNVTAQPGTLDLTFGTAGKAITDFTGADDFGNDIALDGEGRMVLAGYSYNGSNYDFAVVRYNEDGILDNTFNSGGKVTTAIGSSSDYGLSCAIQGDGRIVVSGYSFNGVNNDFALVRFNSDGSLDNTFGTGGKVTTAVGNFGEVAYDMVLQSDGKIILAGYSDDASTNFFALVRYNSDGTLDASFDTDGKVTTVIGPSDDQCYSVTLQGDEKIVASGYSYNGTDWDFAIVRYNPDGSLDNTFDMDGIVTTAIGISDEQCYGVTVQSDGKIVGVGYTSDYWNEFAVVRYNSDGSLDNSFGSGGKVTTNVGGTSNDANEVVIQSDGKIVVAGNALNGSNWDFGLVSYNSDGSVDSTFGINGKVLTDFMGGNDYCLSLTLQIDHKIVAAGFGDGAARDFVVSRYDGGAVGINQANAETEITIYPNPFNTELSVTGLPPGQLIFCDVLGNEILRQQISSSQTKINTAKLSSGIYLLRYGNEHALQNFCIVKSE